MGRKFIIAIDGYSSCGKSTVARELARRLGVRYIDSGAMYRAVTLYFLRNNLPIPGPDQLATDSTDYTDILNKISISFRIDGESGKSEICLNGTLVEQEIRTMEVSDQVSHVSAIPQVRHRMVDLQRKSGEDGSLVMDGRDIGTTVFPHAELKIFMTADPKIRAQRRYEELLAKGQMAEFDDVLRNVVERDHEDSHRLESPLRKANDAVVLDNSHMSREEQIAFVLERVRPLLEVGANA
jgi:cytidylate kinase